MSALLNLLLKAGISQGQNLLISQRIKLVNSLTLAVQVFVLILLVIVIIYGLYAQMLIGAITFFVLFLTYRLNALGWHDTAAYFMINFTSLGILAASYRAYSTSIFAETENWLFACLVIAVFLFDGIPLMVQFVLLFIGICVAKFLKYQMFGLEMGRDFNLLIINSIILSLGIYLTLVIIKEGLKKAITKLEEADLAKTKLLSLLAHDLKNPLSTFEGLLDIAKNDQLTREEFMTIQSGIKERFQPIKESIHGLLDWSMAQLKNSQPETSRFDIMESVIQAEKTMESSCIDKSLHLDIQGDPMAINMDREHFNVIIRNLLHNAVKFSPRNGKIKVAWNSNGNDHVAVSVINAGTGLTPEQIKSILNGRISVSKPGTEGERGTGLGLNLSLELIKKNGGKMEINSDGSITEFTLQIPK